VADEKKKDAAAAAPAPAAAPESDAPAGPKLIMGMPLPLFGFTVLNLVAMLGGLGYIIWVGLIYQKPPITEEHASLDIQQKVEGHLTGTHDIASEEILTDLSEMTILLKGMRGGKTHYITVKTSLSCPSQNCANQVKELKAKVEDAVQQAFSARSFSELAQLETKFRVKHEIITRVNSYLKDAAVTDLYFENFIVQ
jgi:flagellar basal body-associated protein FliL